MQRRREFIQTGIVGATALALGPSFWREALARPARPGRGPYGPLGPPDGNGIRLPEGFRARQVALGGTQVEGTGYAWHIFSDGASTYRTGDGGWILVSNSEIPIPGQGGASAIRFDRGGEIVDAYRILSGSQSNCAGGATPWGTWLSCEEKEDGVVWECDPTGRAAPVERPALGVFEHEAVAVDRRDGRLYLTEDDSNGGFYRFTPRRKGDLSAGKLEIALEPRADGRVRWRRVPDPTAATGAVRNQVRGRAVFKRGEGIWYDSGTVYVATTGDDRIHAYDTRDCRLRTIYDAERLSDPLLTGVDNITVSRSGDLFVCENNPETGPLDIAIITPGRRRRVARFLTLTAPYHTGLGGDIRSELAGVCFNPRGDRMYFASQRAYGVGAVYEVTGPFRRRA